MSKGFTLQWRGGGALCLASSVWSWHVKICGCVGHEDAYLLDVFECLVVGVKQKGKFPDSRFTWRIAKFIWVLVGSRGGYCMFHLSLSVL